MKQSRIDWLPKTPSTWGSDHLDEPHAKKLVFTSCVWFPPGDCWNVDSLAMSGLFILWVETMSDSHLLRPHLYSLAKGEDASHFSPSTHNSSALLCLVLVSIVCFLIVNTFSIVPTFLCFQLKFFLFTPPSSIVEPFPASIRQRRCLLSLFFHLFSNRRSCWSPCFSSFLTKIIFFASGCTSSLHQSSFTIT